MLSGFDGAISIPEGKAVGCGDAKGVLGGTLGQGLGVRLAEEAIVNPRRSAQGQAWKCMLAGRSGLGPGWLKAGCGQEPGGGVSVVGAAVGLNGIGVRPGTCCARRAGSSVLQIPLERRSSLIVFLSHKVFSRRNLSEKKTGERDGME